MSNSAVMKNRWRAAATVFLLIVVAAGFAGQGPDDGASPIEPERLREWLTYLSSDELEGRNTFSEGLGLAAAYISERVREAGVKPAGDQGSYFQRVPVLGVRSTNHSTVTVEVNGQTRTFRDGEGVTFPKNVGGKRTITIDRVQFVGYGLNLGADHDDYKGLAKGAAIVWLGAAAPRSVSASQSANTQLFNRTSIAIDEMGAAATLSRTQEASPPPRPDRNGADFTTVQRLDSPQAPDITADDEFFDFLFSASDVKFTDLKSKSDFQEDLPTFTLKGVKLTFNLDADYQVVSTQYTRNVVGMVEGADPQLRNSYVAFGAHYDHVGYTTGTLPAGFVDRISNGADDDGSGTTTLIALARAFASGQRTKRSLLFVWHAGEEKGLYGSKYFADYPVVPIDSIVTQLNIDMIGRNRDNNPAEANTVYAIGADRISTELHNTLIDANLSLPRPLTIDFEMNAPADPERLYYRSDHYSYAAKGIPVIFFFTGLHPDYHQVTDSVEKIDFNKMARIGQLVYETARRIADLDHPLARDFKGPRTSKGTNGKLPERGGTGQ